MHSAGPHCCKAAKGSGTTADGRRLLSRFRSKVLVPLIPKPQKKIPKIPLIQKGGRGLSNQRTTRSSTTTTTLRRRALWLPVKIIHRDGLTK